MLEPGTRPAATVVVLRPAPGGPEALLVKRSGRMGFFPDAWVFPGGRVDAEDRDVATTGRVVGLEEGRRDHAVAAIRECFEESGVWLGGGQPAEGLRARLAQGAGALRMAPGQALDVSGLGLWSRWVTPDVEPKRYDTLFFVAVAGRQIEALADQQESVSVMWVRPEDLLAAGGPPDGFLGPPTWVTLRELCGYATPEQALSACAERPRGRVMPRLVRDGAAGWEVFLPGHQSHPEPRVLAGATHLRFDGRGWLESP